MDVRSVQSAQVFSSSLKNHGGRTAATQTATPEVQGSQQTASATPVLSADEKKFFEGLFPEARKDVRAYQAYSGKGEQHTSAVTGSLVDRKG